ncbi:MAG: hypothetical protein JOZ75_13360, partial [Candidatus Dormibacteraeota bacterium]|nr:hypothetical protein [Candidatus Dormibacteraeota bacterium]
RAGVEAPNTSLEAWDASGTAPSTHQCTAAEFVYATNNPICLAVANSSGYLKQSLLTSNPCGPNQGCGTIKLLGPTNLTALRHGPVARLMAAPGGLPQTGNSSCNGSQATVTGTITGLPSGSNASISDGQDSTTSNGSTYQLCATPGSQVFTATVSGVCNGYTGSVGPITVVKKNTYTENITVTDPAAQVTGTISGVPSGDTWTLTDTTGDTKSGVTSTYTLCVVADSATTQQTISAQVGPTGCGGDQGSVGPFAVSGGSSYTENFSVSAEPTCTTTTTTATTSSSGTATTSTATGTTSGLTCANEKFSNEDADYISVTVTYPTPIFIPFIGNLFGSNGIRMVTSNVTMAIQPCTLTQGG